MRVVAKMRCFGVETYGGVGRKVKLSPVYVPPGSPDAEKLAEDVKFTNATPSGEYWMTIDNEPAAKAFDLNRDYYVYFVPVEEGPAPDLG